MTSFQRVCSECPTPFVTTSPRAKTCSGSCRSKRKRRLDAGDTADVAGGNNAAKAIAKAKKATMDDLPAVVREVMAEEVRPVVREALSSRVLEAIGSMTELIPLMFDALKDDLVAQEPCVDPATGEHVTMMDGTPVYTVDYDRRSKARDLVAKYTLGQPGLAPQPEAAANAPITVVFPGMSQPEPIYIRAADAIADAPLELPAGVSDDARMCDLCHDWKEPVELVGDSDRCYPCHEAARVKMEARLPSA